MNTKIETMGSLNMASELPNQTRIRSVISVSLALWFGLVLFLGLRGAFVAGAGSPPLPIFFGFAIPLVLFFVAYFG